MTLKTSLLITGDSSSAVQALDDATQAIAGAEAEAEALKAAYARADQSIGALAKVQAQANKEIAGSKADFAAGKIGAEQYERQILETKTALGLMQAEHRKASKELRDADDAYAVAVGRLRDTSDETRKMGESQKLAGHHASNLAFQINDVATQLASGAPPMQVFANQAGQIAQIMGQAGLGIGGLIKQIALMVGGFLAANPLVLAAAAAAAVAVVAFLDFKKSVNAEAKGELDAYAASLGLTKEEIEKAGGAAVTTGDMLLGLWDVFNQYTGVEKMFADVKGWIVDNVRAAVADAKKNIVEIYAAIAATVDGVKHVWKNIGPILGDAVISGANVAIGAVEKLVNSAIDAINTLMLVVNPVLAAAKLAGLNVGTGHISLPRITNQFAGAGAAAADAFTSSYARHVASGNAAVDRAMSDWADASVNRARGRLKKAGEAAGREAGAGAKDGAAKGGKDAGDALNDALVKAILSGSAEALRALESASAQASTDWAKDYAARVAAELGGAMADARDRVSWEWFEEMERRRLEEAQQHRDLALNTANDIADIIGGGVGDAIRELAGALDKAFPEFAAGLGKALEGLSSALGPMAAGAKFGSSVDGLFDAIGIKSSNAGAQIGGAIGQFAGPIGMIAGSILGGIVGGLLKTTPKASATVSIIAGEAAIESVKGNSGKLKRIATGMANSLIDSLSGMAEQLGVTLGDASVSVGQRGKKFVVDPTGAGRTKGPGVINFGKDQAAALEEATRIAISQGAFEGLSEGLQKLLTTGDLKKQFSKALGIQGVLDEAAKNADGQGFDLGQLDKWKAAMARDFEEAGQDMATLEAVYAKRRADIIAQYAEDATNATAEAAARAAEIAAQRHELELRIMEETGRAAEADAIRQADAIALLDPSLQDLKRALDAATKSSVDAAEAQTALAEAQAHAADIATRAHELELQIMEASGRVAEANAIRQQDAIAAAAALDPALGTLTSQLYAAQAATADAAAAQTALAAASAAAAEAETARAAAQAQIAAQRHELELRIMEETGRAAEADAIRQRDALEKLDPSLRDLQQTLWDAQAAAKEQAAAADASTAAARGAADAEAELAKARQAEIGRLQSYAEKMRGFSGSIREFLSGALPGAPGANEAQALAQLRGTTVSAQFGDEAALGRFTGEAKAYLDAALANAGSSFDARRAQSIVANLGGKAIGGADAAANLADQQIAALTAQGQSLNAIETSMNQVLATTQAIAAAPSAPVVVSAIERLSALLREAGDMNAAQAEQMRRTLEAVVVQMGAQRRLWEGVIVNGQVVIGTDGTTVETVPA